MNKKLAIAIGFLLLFMITLGVWMLFGDEAHPPRTTQASPQDEEPIEAPPPETTAPIQIVETPKDDPPKSAAEKASLEEAPEKPLEKPSKKLPETCTLSITINLGGLALNTGRPSRLVIATPSEFEFRLARETTKEVGPSEYPFEEHYQLRRSQKYHKLTFVNARAAWQGEFKRGQGIYFLLELPILNGQKRFSHFAPTTTGVEFTSRSKLKHDRYSAVLSEDASITLDPVFAAQLSGEIRYRGKPLKRPFYKLSYRHKGFGSTSGSRRSIEMAPFFNHSRSYSERSFTIDLPPNQDLELLILPDRLVETGWSESELEKGEEEPWDLSNFYWYSAKVPALKAGEHRSGFIFEIPPNPHIEVSLPNTPEFRDNHWFVHIEHLYLIEKDSYQVMTRRAVEHRIGAPTTFRFIFPLHPVDLFKEDSRKPLKEREMRHLQHGFHRVNFNDAMAYFAKHRPKRRLRVHFKCAGYETKPIEEEIALSPSLATSPARILFTPQHTGMTFTFQVIDGTSETAIEGAQILTRSQPDGKGSNFSGKTDSNGTLFVRAGHTYFKWYCSLKGYKTEEGEVELEAGKGYQSQILVRLNAR